MRNAFFDALMKIAEENEQVYLLVGDLGFGVVEPFAKKYSKRYLNPGVAEQNMTGIAAGIALSGKTVFTYSIGNFPTIRCLEQIRNDVCYHKANVKIVSVGGGYAYGSLGMTHHAIEDLAIMRSLPEMTVVAPGDPIEAEYATRAVVERTGPCYLRLGRAGEPVVHNGKIEFTLGKALELFKGTDITLISTGGILKLVAELRERLLRDNINARVLSMHTLKPLDTEAILSAARETEAIFAIEEHSIIGGLGGAVAEVLAESNLPKVHFKRFALPSVYTTIVGDQDYLRKIQGLTVEKMLKDIKQIIGHKKPMINSGADVKKYKEG